MMNFDLPKIPARPEKSREYGLTMVMDKGLSLQETANMIDAGGEYIDLVKLGFGTSLITKNLKEKVKLYQQAGIKVYVGGTCFEAFIVRGMFDDYRRYVSGLGLDTAEVSDGTMEMKHDDKLGYIEALSKDFTVLSEVGSKIEGREITNAQWVGMMDSELKAGAWKVIAEARESGNIGIYQKNGSVNLELVEDIKNAIKLESILWEAPQKSQQTWFIKNFGANVNLGNIATGEVISLETLRLGLRGDTLLQFI
ncbi:MAG: phosphosulfolactate synthase [Paludibacteraceae bacterium]|jgi:phosphosulfolactate synthase|nr:phosphosulfolactate synthase [Paludibacteraceae bacterium]MBR6311013.1 phosphosulfolactate synthase [Paludibacteraceae bacterium]MDD6357729.1 phosphosulfolactate synthase [Bacteroidales bacterium]